MNTIVRCPECGRLFDIRDEADADELAYGHDCEPEPAPRRSRERYGEVHNGGIRIVKVKRG